MFGPDKHSTHRAATIALFHRYVEARRSLETAVGHPDSASKRDLELLKAQVQQLADNQYLLAIVGEAKSGKSSFINALLGASLLPTGVLQCTSAIIEIVDTDNQRDRRSAFLKVQYGDSTEPRVEVHHETASETRPIRERLAEIAAVRDEYRALPVNQLAQQLLIDRPEEITGDYVSRLLAMKTAGGDELFENPHQLKDSQFRRLVREYLAEYRDLSRVPVKIVVGYPIGYGFADLRIVDTPGVNARGGLDDTTRDYLCNANAVLFVHPVGNIASESFRGFFIRSTPVQAKKNAFLILTHRFQLKSADVDLMLKEARRLFPENEIRAGRIVAVDSMLKIIADLLARGVPLAEIFSDEELRKLVAPYWFEGKQDPRLLREAVLRESHFGEMQLLLQDFVQHALADQMRWLLDRIGEGLTEHVRIYTDNIGLLRSKLEKSPEEFGKEIEQINAMLDDYLSLLQGFSKSLRKSYTGQSGAADVESLTDKYRKSFREAQNVDEIKKLLLDLNHESDSVVNAKIAAIRSAYEKKMTDIGAKLDGKFSVKPPKIQIEDLTARAKERAYDTITMPGDRAKRAAGGAAVGGVLGALGGLLFLGGPLGALAGAAVLGIARGASEYFDGSPARKQQVFSDGKYISELRTAAVGSIPYIRDGVTSAVGTAFDTYSSEFETKLKGVIETRQRAYEKLKLKKQHADGIAQSIQVLQSNEAAAAQGLTTIGELRAVL
jgi:GTPase SAR1 family protein